MLLLGERWSERPPRPDEPGRHRLPSDKIFNGSLSEVAAPSPVDRLGAISIPCLLLIVLVQSQPYWLLLLERARQTDRKQSMGPINALPIIGATHYPTAAT